MALELILQIVTPLIIEPIRDYAIAPIKRHASYAFKCDSKLQGLKEQVEQLQSKKLRLQQSVDDAMRSGEEVFPDVSKWLNAAEKDIGEAEELILRKDNAMKNKCFFGFCPNLKTRYRLSKSAEKKALAIGKLCNQEGLDSISFPPHLQQIVEPSLYSREALPSRVLLLNQAMDALRDPNLNTIGVFGMGGVGKTTFAKEVQARSLQEKLFETVVLVAVSQAPEIRRIQGEISDFLGLKFTAEEIPKRASELFRRLENSNMLIILDDLWEKLDLNAVGIPSLGASKGCKIMLTSRNRDLLSSEMRAQKLFALEALKEEETLCLFQMSIVEAKDPKFRHIATQIANKCGGLPLLVQIVAMDLTNKELYEWSNKLNQLSAFGDEEIYQKVYRVLESSYDNLPGEEMKQFFLLCSLFGQANIQIQYLLTHSMGLGLFKRIQTVEAARDKVLTLISKLKAKSLLLDGDMAGYVKMHDVVRDTALSIASRVQHAFIGAGEVRFKDWPNRDCTRISLPYCNVTELPEGLDCPEAEVFFLFTEDLSLEIPNPFFDGMKKLKVADLRGMRLVSLPSSFGLLTNLQTLCLRNCKLDSITVLGELRKLEFLSLANSNIVELPREIEALTQLKLLDLQGCSDLLVIHENLFSKLCSLEELYMLNSFERWNAKGNVRFVELENLDRLSTLEIEIPDPKMIPEGFKCFSQLRRYKISIGCSWDWEGEPERSRMLKLKVEAGVRLEYDPELLLRETEDLVLDGVKGIDNLFYERFLNLKHMHVQNDDDIQYLIKSTIAASHSLFPVLESLHLEFLESLETICSGQLTMESFKQLQILKISDCDKLSSLLSFSSLKCLQQLRELEVVSCRNMEAVVGERNEDEGIELTHLSSLKLSGLPHLTGFCKITEGTEPEQMGMLFNARVSFPNLTSLEVDHCGSLKHIYTASTVKCLMQLKRLEISFCGLVEEIIQSKKMEEIEGDSREAIVFPKLDHLSLVGLDNVKWFSSSYPIKFPFLRKLRIMSCPNMRNLVGRDSSSESSEEYLFNEMVTFSNLETLAIYGLHSIKYLWDEQHIADDSFSKLKSISIERCSKLAVVFPSELCTRFRRVEMLCLSDCDGVEEIYPRINLKEVNDPFSLRELDIIRLGSLKHIWNEESEWNKGAFSTFQNLQTLEVKKCKDLRCVFPASVGCGLPQLQRLQLERCNHLEVMIAKAKDDGGSINASFQFPQLRELQFKDLKEMRSLYEGGPHALECPNLTSLTVLQCSNIPLAKFIANVEQLIVDEQGLHAILGCADVSGGFCSKLKKVTLCSVNEETSTAAIFSFLSELKSLEMLYFHSCSLEEIFRLHVPLDRRPIGDEQHHCVRVKRLELQYIKKLNFVIKEDSQINKHLQTLRLFCCDDLMGIAPSSTSLRNLTALHVSDCNKMKNVITASTAKTMEHLKEMTVDCCKRIEEIVAKDGDGTDHDELIFKKLQRLTLIDLPNLNSFCSNKYSFRFPLLEKVIIRGCPEMKSFGGGDVCTEILRGILFEDEQQWEGNLNATISAQLRTWVGEHLEDGIRFHNLKSLEVVNSTSSSKALLLANQMRYLKKLGKITVRDCDSIQVVFDLEGLSAEEGYVGLFPTLLELNLANLPLLTQLCNKNPKGIIEFDKLTWLNIDNCSSLKYVLTWSMASCLSRLFRVEVKNCEMMETLIVDEEDVADRVTFNSLEDVVLENMPRFSSIYSGSGDLEFPSLEEVTIRRCPSIKALLVSTQVHSTNRVGEHLEDGIRFHNLESLQVVNSTSSSKALLLANQMRYLNKLSKITVRDCDSIQVVFDLEGLSAEEGYVGLLPKLEKLKLVNLPSLAQLCSKTPKGIMDFSQLEALSIDNCSSLKYVLTWSMASCLSQLFRVEVKNCEMMETLIVDEEDVADRVTFNSLEDVVLENMPRFSSIYSGSGDLEFPSLEEVTIRRCPSIKALLVSTQVHSTNRAFPKLEKLSIDMKSVEGMMQYQAATDLFSGVKILELTHCSAKATSHVLLVCFLSRFTNLDQLELRDSSLQELLDSELDEALTMRHIKSIRLYSLFDLNKIWWRASLVHSLETLKVDGCNQLMNLMTPSMAKSMVQLKLLRIRKCKMLMEIVGDGSDQTTDEIVFPKLETLELIDLQSLKAFSSTHYNFNFPCLDRVLLRGCPNLGIFCNGIVNTTILNCVLDSEYGGSRFWEGDLKTTTGHLYHQMVGFVYFEEIKLSALPMLKENWEAEFPTNFLSFLRRLAVDNCKLFSHALPSRLLKLLGWLKVLIVEKCDSVERVVDFEGLNASECEIDPTRNLEELQLLDLPRLKQVWSKDHLQILGFKNLQTLKVDNCGSLTFIFNLSMALSLRNLQHVEVKTCSLVEHIILLSEEDTVQQCQTIFPSLQSLALLHLANLVGFCSTSGVLELPSLKMIEVADCPNAEMFASEFSEVQQSSITVGIQDPDSITAFAGTKMIIPGLEELKVEWTPLKDQLFGNYRSGFLSKLKRIELTSFRGKEDANFLSNILRHFRSLENLCLTDSLIEEVTLDDLSDLKDDNNESALTRLKISNFPMLKHLVRDDCQPIPLFENLVDLEVIECSSLKILVPSLVSFLNLTDLQVSKCDGLTTLLSASTARSLVQLRRMDVKDCKMMQEIVAISSDGEEYEIRFSRLDYLELEGLPCLESFSSGNYDFHFPSLEEVIIRGCPNMKNFTEKVSVSPKLWKVKTGQHEYDWEWEGSLNNTIQALYVQKEVEETAAINN